MPQRRYTVTLTKEERLRLTEITTKGVHSNRKVLNALILLGMDEGSLERRQCATVAVRAGKPRPSGCGEEAFALVPDRPRVDPFLHP